MKNKLIIISISLMFIAGCKTIYYPNEVKNSQFATETGTILVHATGYGNTEYNATVNAEKAAFNTLLFKGVPGSQYYLPLVEKEAESMEAHKDFYKNFFDNGGYKSFVVSTNSSPLVKVKGNKKIESDIKINVLSLRTNLEQNNIIRKFGY